MRDELTRILVQTSDDASVDRIMAVSFFRTRPMQAGTLAPVIRLDDRQASGATSSRARARARP